MTYFAHVLAAMLLGHGAVPAEEIHIPVRQRHIPLTGNTSRGDTTRMSGRNDDSLPSSRTVSATFTPRPSELCADLGEDDRLDRLNRRNSDGDDSDRLLPVVSACPMVSRTRAEGGEKRGEGQWWWPAGKDGQRVFVSVTDGVDTVRVLKGVG